MQHTILGHGLKKISALQVSELWYQLCSRQKHSGQQRGASKWLSCALLIICLVGAPSFAQTPSTTLDKTASSNTVRLVVFQPLSARNPRSPFANLLEGINKHKKTTIIPYDITRDTDITTVNNWLNTQQFDAIISLGRTSYQLVSRLKGKEFNIKKPIIAGGVSLNPNGISGISLSGDPRQFFQQLKKLSPETKSISIVFSEKMNGWWVHLAENIAKDYQLQMKLYPADNIRDAARQYKLMLQESQAISDAIWIPLIDLAPTKTVLPVVLKAAWKKNLPVFSNNPLHTRQGTLFSLYPNNASMGKQLADMAIDAIAQTGKPQVQLASDLKIAFNRRTAAHLGLKVSRSQLQSFDRIYPLK